MTKILAAILALLALPTAAAAQRPLDLRIEVAGEGLHEISWHDLASFTEGRPLDTERLRLSKNGVEVPISFRAVNGTRFDRASSIVFHAGPPTNPHTKRSAFRLEGRPGTLRIPERAVAATVRTVGEAVVIERFEEDLLFEPSATVQERWLDPAGQDPQPWYWARLKPTSGDDKRREDSVKNLLLRLEIPSRPVDRTPATLVIRLRSHLGREVEQSLGVEFAGRKLGERRWREPGRLELEFEVPLEDLKSDNILRLENTSTERTWADPGNQTQDRMSNDILIDSVELRFKTLLTGPTAREPQMLYEIEAPAERGRVLLRFTNPSVDPFRLYDVARAAWLRAGEIDVAPGERVRVVACSSEGTKKPVEVAPWSARDLRFEREGGDWVCITLERFAEFVQPLADWRASRGLRPLVVTDREVYDAFAGGDFDPTAIRRFLQSGLDGWKTKPRFVLLVGDADHDVDWVSERRTLPTALVPTYYNGLSASDRALMPDATIAVGRLPARRPDEVIRMAARTIEYERAAADGPWRRRLNFIASEGRFGPVVDALIERYAARVLTEVIPAAYDVTMTYASAGSSYLYPPAEFNDQVLRRFNEGALVFAYMGHGYAQGFDQLRVGDKRYPIFSRRDVASLDAGERSPLAVIVACSTAEFDDPKEDAVAEDLMRASGGALALVGGTRITHPFPNSLLAKELLTRLFLPEAPTIGEALVAAQNAIRGDWKSDPVAALAKPLVGSLAIDRLMDDHRHLYVLFGDPAARLARPAETIALAAPERLVPGMSAVVEGKLATKEKTAVVVTLEVRRDRLVEPLAKIDARDETSAAAIKSNYEAANDKILVRLEFDAEDGAFAVTLPLPAELPAGPAVIKAAAGSAVGGLPVVIEQTAPEAAPEKN